MSELNPPLRENYKGLSVHFLNGKKGKASVVISKDIWIPGKEFGWMYFLNGLGFNVAYAPYRGTWMSEGKFISHAEGALSITEDVSDLIQFSLERFGSSQVYILSYSLGGPPSLVAGTRFKEVTKIFMYGAPVFTDDPELNRKYEAGGDNVAKVGANLAQICTQGGYFFDGYPAFNLEAWNRLIRGTTKLNPYKYLEKISEMEIFAIHSTQDKLVHCGRTTDFAKALKKFCADNGVPAKIAVELIDDGRGHKSGFGFEELVKAGNFFSDAVEPSVWERIKTYVGNHRRRVQKPDGGWMEIPFHDLVVGQVDEFQKGGILHREPALEEILGEIF